ncbi:hypothetical protein H6F44_11825 [Pseudanabaena sp. FACHB-1277]|uniref:Uncharacterized protein n=1 Tax=Pseudanabaena cinerea FACHB-1277 TaxID=2949581 RepID=A0A926UTZ2_9CYAN|nr:hypothetical protein [Pseudanabaena cinerea]MBD2150803.1 hypothetical protein [Pseudanabaena cinerea FACHB-1277]
MRGAGRIGGRDFSPRPIKRAEEPDLFGNTANPFFGELPVPPTLTPINDEWSISDPFEPVDPRDCSKYPASPYCEGNTIRLGPPIGFEIEVRTNGCTTCLYTYPVVGWVKLTPTIVCRRDPNCKEDNPPPPSGLDIINALMPPPYDENPQPNQCKTPECASREGIINRWHNRWNRGTMRNIRGFIVQEQQEEVFKEEIKVEAGAKIVRLGATEPIPGYGDLAPECHLDLSFPFSDTDRAPWVYHTFADTYIYQSVLVRISRQATPQSPIFEHTTSFTFISWTVGRCCGVPANCAPLPPPPPPPPPFGRDDKRKRKKDPEERMCCNSCRDANDNADKANKKADDLLKELKEIKKILGTGKLPSEVQKAVKLSDQSLTGLLNLLGKTAGIEKYPIEVPRSLLTGTGDQVDKLQSQTDFMFWLTNQLDSLIGEFPIEIEVKDIDPLTKGDQKQKIQLPNLAEAIAEIYGLVAKGAVNQEVDQAMLLRIAAEVIAAKNGIAITQDYAKANAKFLGYKGNPADRELTYQFDFSKLVLGEKDQEVRIDEILQTVKGHVKGWQNEDKETAADFFMKLMFAAGIIKSVFFRNKKQMREVLEKADEQVKERLKSEDDWKQFLKDINNPNSPFNRGESSPDIKEEK